MCGSEDLAELFGVRNMMIGVFLLLAMLTKVAFAAEIAVEAGGDAQDAIPRIFHWHGGESAPRRAGNPNSRDKTRMQVALQWQQN